MELSSLISINLILVSLSLTGIALLFVLYPLLLFMLSRLQKKEKVKYDDSRPFVSLLIVVRNAETLIDDKIHNSLALDYPREKYEVVVFSDGSTDKTEKKLASFEDKRLKVFSSNVHDGKSKGINRSVNNCMGDIIVFSDVDAILEPAALEKLVRHYADPDIGGVCGQRIIHKDDTQLKDAQKGYIKFDSLVKELESRIGSITSNDGKIYSIRKELFTPIEEAVTDDLFISLSVVRQRRRFIFEPKAKAYIRVPSRNPAHEIQRRRRIVPASLRGIWLSKELLNPMKYRFFSIGLIINKIIRRLLPVCLSVLLLSSLIVSVYSPFFAVLFAAQSVFYLLAVLYPILFRRISGLKPAKKVASLAYYFCLGNYATFLGLLDFTMGRKISRWEPIKTDMSDP